MPGLVYLLCTATSLASGLLLLRGAVTRGGGLLFWSSLCFFGMALNNVLMYIDAVVVPGIDLSFWPSFMMEPLPNARSIWESAAASALDLSTVLSSTRRSEFCAML